VSDTLKEQRDEAAENAFDRSTALYEAERPQEAVDAISGWMKQVQLEAMVTLLGRMGFKNTDPDSAQFWREMHQGRLFSPDLDALLDEVKP
jgi:hypothetical protein